LGGQDPAEFASMGPPIYIGGNQTPEDSAAPGYPRFNGATDLYRWKQQLLEERNEK